MLFFHLSSFRFFTAWHVCPITRGTAHLLIHKKLSLNLRRKLSCNFKRNFKMFVDFHSLTFSFSVHLFSFHLSCLVPFNFSFSFLLLSSFSLKSFPVKAISLSLLLISSLPKNSISFLGYLSFSFKQQICARVWTATS